MKLKVGGLYETKHGAIVEALSKHASYGGTMRCIVKRVAPGIMSVRGFSRYEWPLGNAYYFSTRSGMFGGEELDSFEGHIIREIEP